MTKIFREPLLHFIILASVIFSLSEWPEMGFLASSETEKIVVTQAQIQNLRMGFEKVYQRAPSEKDLESAIQTFIYEEVLYREALSMGLDRNDDIVRRRLSQKVQFLSEDLSSLEEPEEQELEEYLATHADDYRLPSRFTFQQIYLSTSKRGESVSADAIALMKELRINDSDAAKRGDSLMVDYQFTDQTEREIARSLGNGFVQSLDELPVGIWQGPITSGFGIHLVLIQERVEAKPAQLANVRKAVLRDFKADKRTQTNKLIYDVMRSRYEVTVEKENPEAKIQKTALVSQPS